MYSSVYLNPVKNTGPVNSLFTLNVLLNLTGDERINAFDLRINYSLPHVLVAPSAITYSNNIFSSMNIFVLHSCIDSRPLDNNVANACENGDGYGQIHFSEEILGTEVPGPMIAGLLFSVMFNVTGTSPGDTMFILDRANLADPVGSDPSNANPHLVPDVTMAAFFANQGIVSFYNFHPTTSVAFLPSENVVFDASASYDNASTIVRYIWDFGDSSSINVTSPVVTHSYLSAGNYTVTLQVKNALGNKGMPISWTVSIVRALGAITIAMNGAGGSKLLTDVNVKLFNSTLSLVPFAQSTSSSGVSFAGLSPGSYYLTFSGLSIMNYSRTEIVTAGLTTTDSVYLTVIPPSSSQTYVLDIFYGSLVVAVAVLAGVIVLRWKRGREGRARSRKISEH